jgi:hypothetical protein
MRIKIILLMPILLIGCFNIRNTPINNYYGKYCYIDKNNNFYDELTIELKSNNTFVHHQRVGPETFEVSGIIMLGDQNNLYLTVTDTTTILRTIPIYEYYKVTDTLRIINNRYIKLGNRKYKKM